jgi:glycosyltransferase involved in cell wall biosynthesis
MATKPRLLFVVTEDWYFISHRLNLALAARDAGFDVGVATRVSTYAEKIEEQGIELFALRFMRRASRNPWVEFKAVDELTALYRRWRPSIAHHVAAKPVIYGARAAQRTGVPAVVNALAGLGFVFTSASLQARALQPFMLNAYRKALRHSNSRLIVQNAADEDVVLSRRLIEKSAIRRIAGSGVDTSVFLPSDEPPGIPVILLAARMLVDKGVHEFVEAARIAKSRGLTAKFVLVGATDSENPAAIPTEQLRRWHSEGDVEWWGHRQDMPSVLSLAHIVCLPSYREGLPKVLLEAAACARPTIATDVPGCRDIAVHNETALLVPARDAAALADAMQTLAGDAQLRHRLGHRARELVCNNFTVERVNAQTIDVYRELLDGCEPS